MAARSKSTSITLDPTSATRSSLDTILRLPSFTESEKGLFGFSDNDYQVEDEATKLYEKRSFMKLKRDHWIEPRLRSNCTYCSKYFGLTSKKFNCRRCGEIFCGKCCHYRRRLSADAQPTSDGHYYRVCYKCSDIHEQSFGETRSLTEFFKNQRSGKRINVLKELDRLVEGFKVNVKVSRLNSVVTETFSNIKVPLWQRSYKWLESKEVEWCSKCSGKFTLFMQKHHCRICGSVFCHKCSCQDLMLYCSQELIPRWALIRVVGCPDEEPNVCLYLTICSMCHEEVENIQVSKFYDAEKDNGDINQKMEAISKILVNLNVCEDKIQESLIIYQEMVENMLDGNGKLNQISESGKSVVQTFAKFQVDISDLFAQYGCIIQGLKLHRLTTQRGRLLMYNIMQVKSGFYNAKMSTFKYYKDNLSKTMPIKALQQVQNYADKQAINSTRITTRQLGLEVLHLSTKYSLDHNLAEEIVKLDEICCEELRVFIQESGGDWKEHCERLDQLVKELFQSKRMVVPSERLTKEGSCGYLQAFVLKRCNEILQQTQRQMMARSSGKKFARSKETLTKLIESTNSNSKVFDRNGCH